MIFSHSRCRNRKNRLNVTARCLYHICLKRAHNIFYFYYFSNNLRFNRHPTEQSIL